MTDSLAMGIDLGGSGIRCLLLNPQTDTVVCASRRWRFPAVDDTGGLGFSIDLDGLWSLLTQACQEVMQRAQVSPEQLCSVAVSAMRFTTVMLDDDGHALQALPNRDARATAEYFQLAESHGDQFLARGGMWPLSIHLAPRLLWMRSHRPDDYAKTTCVLSLADWLNFRLCGLKASDFSQAAGTGLLDLQQQSWNTSLLGELGLPSHIFPELKQSGTVLGNVTADAAGALGLSQETKVVMGGGDTPCSLLAAGVVEAGDSACVAGSTTPVITVVESPSADPSGACWTGQHLLPGRWLMESSGGPMGETLQWFSRLLFPGAPQPELRLFAEAKQSEYGAKGLLSTLGADIMNGKFPALPAGLLALTHLSTADDPNPRRHLCRALVEGYACAVRANVEVLTELTGVAPKALTLTDGFSRSDVFSDVLATLSNLPVQRMPHYQSAAMGAALCAAHAFSGEPSLAETADRFRGLCKTTEPATHQRPQAEQVYREWVALRQAAEKEAAPQISNHMVGHVFAPSTTTGARSNKPPEGLAALITADFDEASLRRLGDVMDVKYRSFRQSGRLLTGADMVKAMQERQVLVTEIDIVDAKALQQLPDLRIVAACRGNAVNVDIEACSAFGVPVISAPGRNAVAVADLTVTFILALSRKLTDAADFLKDDTVTAGNMAKMGQAFGQLQGRELWRKTIGLVGLGAVGRMVAERLQGFGARLIAADPFATPEAAALAGCELVTLETLLQEADFVSLHAAVTPETTGMIGAEQLALMKPSAFLINTARAALVDEAALIQAVQSEQLAGAGLDTFDEEPPGFDHPLVQHPNVLSTPHVAGNTVEIADHQGESVSNALLQLLSGERPVNCLNPEVLENFDLSQPRQQLSEEAVTELMSKPGPAVTDLEKNKKQKAAGSTSANGASEVTAPQDIIDRMRALLQAFCDGMASDEEVKAFSADQDVCLAFNLPDVGIDFYFGLHNGTVDSALGQNDNAEVMLTMRAETLDGMYSGQLDTMKAAMNGDIAFVGDAAKAMTIQQLARNMKRIYLAAKEQAGDPGDLSAIPKPGAAAQHSQQIEDVRDVRHELVETVNELYEHHIITATGGNVSVRNPDNPDECWITPSQMFKGDLRPELMVRINLDGKPLDVGSRSPSSEWGFHTLTLKKKRDANAVIHAHAPNATILANSDIPFLPISSDAAFFGDIQRIPFIMPGSNELAERVSDALRNEWAVFMVNHGIVVAGRSLRRASDMAQIIERTAEVILGCYQATGGKPPSVLPDEAVKLFRSMADIIA